MHAPSVFASILLQPQSIKRPSHRHARDKIENLDEHRILDAIGKQGEHAMPVLDERGREKHGERYAFAVGRWEKPAEDLGFWTTALDTVK